MRRRSRTRRVMKWVGMGTCVLILAAFALTRWWHFGRRTPLRSLLILSGSAHLSGFELIGGEDTLRGQPGWKWSRNFYTPAQWPSQLPLWISIKSDTTGPARGVDGAIGWYTIWRVVVPLWIPFAVVLVPTAFLWWRDRRRIPLGHCQHCGYDLTGNVSGRCPECGRAIGTDGEARNANG